MFNCPCITESMQQLCSKSAPYTSWSALLYIRAFWNISIMSLWNSLVVRIVYKEKTRISVQIKHKFIGKSYHQLAKNLPHFQCSSLLW